MVKLINQKLALKRTREFIMVTLNINPIMSYGVSMSSYNTSSDILEN